MMTRVRRSLSRITMVRARLLLCLPLPFLSRKNERARSKWMSLVKMIAVKMMLAKMQGPLSSRLITKRSRLAAGECSASSRNLFIRRDASFALQPAHKNVRCARSSFSLFFRFDLVVAWAGLDCFADFVSPSLRLVKYSGKLYDSTGDVVCYNVHYSSVLVSNFFTTFLTCLLFLIIHIHDTAPLCFPVVLWYHQLFCRTCAV